MEKENVQPRQIYSYLENYFNKEIMLKRKFKALVTAGRLQNTSIQLDISNEFGGKQGYEIALALNKIGINTKLIIGPSNLSVSLN